MKFNLKIIETQNIFPHEEFDVSRSEKLVESITRLNRFLNPILVAHIHDETYMQIDGMNRYNAIKQLGIPSILAQVIDYNDQEALEVSTWSHFNSLPKKEFLDKIAEIDGLNIAPAGFRYLRRRYIKESGAGFLCAIVFKDLSVYRVATSGNLSEKIKRLCDIVHLYKKQVVRDQLPDDANSIDVQELYKKNNTSSLVIFPTFTRHQIIDLALNKRVLLPGGVTRFIIKGRCLDVNLPLEYLKSHDSIEQKNQRLKEFLNTKKYRVYLEPTIYFEP